MKNLIKTALAKVGGALSAGFSDILISAGVAGISVGAWMVYAPAGFIVGGVLLLVGGVLAAKT